MTGVCFCFGAHSVQLAVRTPSLQPRLPAALDAASVAIKAVVCRPSLALEVARGDMLVLECFLGV